jgi:cytochrome c-type biogenesis protein CcmH
MKLFFFLLLFMPSVAVAQDGGTVSETTAQEIFGETMSPYCPGLLLRDCPSGKATELKNEIRNRLNQGESKESVEASLKEQYGTKVQAVPDSSPVGILGWIAPILFILAGGAVFIRWVKKNSSDGE